MHGQGCPAFAALSRCRSNRLGCQGLRGLSDALVLAFPINLVQTTLFSSLEGLPSPRFRAYSCLVGRAFSQCKTDVFTSHRNLHLPNRSCQVLVHQIRVDEIRVGPRPFDSLLSTFLLLVQLLTVGHTVQFAPRNSPLSSQVLGPEAAQGTSRNAQPRSQNVVEPWQKCADLPALSS